MLYKGEVKQSEKDVASAIKSLAEDFGGKLPKVIQINTLDEHPYHWWDKENSKMRAPAWDVIPNRYRNKDGDEVILCDNFIRNENGRHTYQIDDKLAVRNGNPLFFKDTDWDALAFLYNHVRRADSKNHNPKDHKPMFYIVNKKKDAIKTNTVGKSIARAYEILYKELDNQPDRTKDIARAMTHTDVSKLSHEEVQALLKSEIDKKETNLNGQIVSGAECFIYFTEGNHTYVPAKIREAKEMGLILFEANAWFWLQDGKKGEIICKVLPTESPERSVIEYFKINIDSLNQLSTSVDVAKKALVTA